jgi:anti-sigma factor RsiW
MNVTREIVKDLLPMYVAGEVSADSRAAVEAALREDTELARLADALRAGEPALPIASAPPSGHRAALDRTKAILRRRTWLLALALFFTGLPLSFTFDSGGLSFLLIRDAPIPGSLFFATGAALWVAFAVTARRLRVTGL